MWLQAVLGEPRKLTLEQEQARKYAEAAVEESLEQATPVPNSFEQAVGWACKAVLRAAEAGNMRQTVYFDTGGKEKDVNGALGAVLPFAETFSKALAAVQAAEGGRVRVVFGDMGTKSMCEAKWAPLPEALILDHYPQMKRGQQEAFGADRVRLMELLDCEILVSIVPQQTDLPAILYLMQLMKDIKKEVPLVMVNARLIQNATIAAGDLMRQFQRLEATLVQTFHLEQFDPPEKEGLNSAVVCRVWPKPFSVWEDSPDDPEAVDGFFLLDINDEQVQSIPDVKEMLASSKMLAQKIRKK